MASNGWIHDGYVRKLVKGRRKFEHIEVWEKENGPVPPGMIVHHKDENKRNNSIENLQLMTRLEHNRLHSGCRVIKGEWWKPCGTCNQLLELEKMYYRSSDGHWRHECKACSNQRMRRYRQSK